MLTHVIAEPRTARSRPHPRRPDRGGPGFNGLSMTAVADTASVTRRTAYLHCTAPPAPTWSVHCTTTWPKSKDSPIPSRRCGPRPIRPPRWTSGPRLWPATIPGLLAVDRALQRVRGEDADAEAHYVRVTAGQLQSTSRLAQWLKGENRLAQPWTVASSRDMLFALTSSDLIGDLIEVRNRSRQRLADHLAVVFRSTLLIEAIDQPTTGSRTRGGVERG